MENHKAAREQVTFIANDWLKMTILRSFQQIFDLDGSIVGSVLGYFRKKFVSSHLASRFSPRSYVGS